MNTFKVAYCPPISENAEKIISENITPSMVSIEGDSNQYCLDFIKSDIIDLLEQKDQDAINLLIDEKVDYIEF